MRHLDLVLFGWLAAGQQPHPWILTLMSALAVGSSWLCAGIVGWLVWRRPSQRGYVMAVLVVSAIAGVLSHWIAAALNLPRPFVMGLSPLYIAHGAQGSLPSTHASVMFTIALALLLHASLRRGGIAVFALAAATGWARIYVGVHFPLDILAGLLLAAVLVVVFAAICRVVLVHLVGLADRWHFAGRPLVSKADGRVS